MSSAEWWCTPLIPALGRQRQADLCEFETTLVYRASTKTGSKAIQINPVSKNKQTSKQKATRPIVEDFQKTGGLGDCDHTKATKIDSQKVAKGPGRCHEPKL